MGACGLAPAGQVKARFMGLIRGAGIAKIAPTVFGQPAKIRLRAASLHLSILRGATMEQDLRPRSHSHRPGTATDQCLEVKRRTSVCPGSWPPDPIHRSFARTIRSARDSKRTVVDRTEHPDAQIPAFAGSHSARCCGCRLRIRRHSPQPPIQSARVIVKYKADSPLLRKQALSAAATGRPRAGARHAHWTGAARGRRRGRAHAGGVRERHHLGTAGARLAAESDVEYAVPDQRRHHIGRAERSAVSRRARLAGDPAGPLSASGICARRRAKCSRRSNVEAGVGPHDRQPEHRRGGDRHRRALRPPRPAARGRRRQSAAGLRHDQRRRTANDGDGRDADASDPGDWVTLAEIQRQAARSTSAATSPEDSSWHGTQTSGLIGALTNNGIGMASVGRNVRVLPVRVLGKCGGFDSDIIAGMRWAAGLAVPGVPANPNPARVLNLSLGGDGACTRGLQRCRCRDQRRRRGRRGGGRQQHRACGRRRRPIARASSPSPVCGMSAPRSASRTSGPRSASARPAGNCVNIGPAIRACTRF